ncbi:MAG: hypothetical protein IKV81_03670 [Clostridia bacterium]|nr:hypothetical protein [Clostridia bacterium]
MKTEQFDIKKLGSQATTKTEVFDALKLGAIGDPDPEFAKKIKLENDIKKFIPNPHKQNYVTNAKGETVIPKSDRILQDIKQKTESEFLLTTVGSKYYDEEYVNQLNYSRGKIPIHEKLLVNSAKNKIAAGQDLNLQERDIVLKYGVANVLGDTLKKQYDIFATDNPNNVARANRFREYAQKEMKGMVLTEAERDTIETYKMLENYKKEVASEESILTSDTKLNGQKKSNVLARQMYNDTAYGGTLKLGNNSVKINEIPVLSAKEKEIQTSINRFGNQMDLYMETGLVNYFVNTFDGLKTGYNLITGQDSVSGLKDKTDSPYAIASSVLKQHFIENRQSVNIAIQDTVTNMAQNMVPMAMAIATGGLGGSGALAQFVSTATFAPSVFGGAYKEGIQKGVTDPNKLLFYATVTTVTECGLEALLGASFNPAGGALTGEIVSNLSSKFSGVFAKAALKMTGNAVGEFVEEGLQSILGPLFTELLLGVDDTTIFDDPLGALSQAAYEGLIGALSASFMGASSNIAAAYSEANIQAYGKNYKSVVGQVGANINDIATYFKETTKNKNLIKLCDKVISGDHSDLTIGQMLVAANQVSKTASQQMYSIIGEKINNLEGGVNAVLSIYQENVNDGAIYPDKVNKLYQTVKLDNEKGEVKDSDIGQLALEVQAYAPRSLILGQTLQKLETKTPVLQSSANGEDVQNSTLQSSANGENVQNSALQSNANGDIINNGQQTVTGDDINGSTDPELLAGRRVSAVSGSQNNQRKYSVNTEIIRGELGTEQSSTGIPDKNVAAGESGWISSGEVGPTQRLGSGLDEGFLGSIRRIKLKAIDSVGRLLSENLQDKLSDTIFKTEDGTIMSLFHWSPNLFDEFKYGDGVFHLGTLSAALTVKRRDAQQRSGHILETYVLAKNPLIVRDDGRFGAYNICKQLVDYGIMSQDECNRVSEMDGFFSDKYEAPANVYVREFLKKLGYDSYLYQNLKEAQGTWSVGVFDPEQIIIVADNGILKENNGVSEADLDNGPASFMPENDSDNSDNASNNSNNDVADSNNDSGTSENESERFGLREPESKSIYRKSTDEETARAIITGQREDNRMRHLKDIAKKFGITVQWSDRYVKGAYDPDTKTIYLNPNLAVTEMYIEVFKHEFTHYLEGLKRYESFKKYLMQQSNSFEKYVRDALEKENGAPFEGSRQEAIDTWVNIYWENRKNSQWIPKKIRDAYTRESIEREIVADFVAEETLFGSNAEKVTTALEEMAAKQHDILQKIKDWLQSIIDKLSGAAQNRTLTEDLKYINDRIARVTRSGENTRVDNGGVKYSLTREQVRSWDISWDKNNDSSLKEQLREHLDEINKMQPVATVVYNKQSGKPYYKVLDELLKNHFGYVIQRKEYGSIIFDAGTIESVRNYINNDAEAAAIISAPYVLKRGKAITGHKNHKGKGNVSVTFAAPVVLNKQIGNVAVCVMYGKGQVHSLRVLTPEGKTFELLKIEDTESTITGHSQKTMAEPYIDSVSDNSIPKPKEKVNKKFSDASPYFVEKMNKLSEDFKNGKITLDEFISGMNDLAESEHKASTDLRRALAETTEINDRMLENLTKSYERKIGQYQKRIIEQNKSLAERRSEISKKITAQREERADKTRNIECIRRSVSRMDTKLRSNSDAKHVPQELKELAFRTVAVFNFNDTSPFRTKDLRTLRVFYKNAYDTVKDNPDILATKYDPDIIEMLKTLEEKLEGKKLRDLSILETAQVRNIVEHFEWLINDENKIFINGKKFDATEIGVEELEDLTSKSTKKELPGTAIFDKEIKYKNMTPVYFFDNIGGVLRKVFGDFVKGQDKWYRNVESAHVYIQGIKEKYNYSKWDNDTLELTTEDGHSIKLTREQALLLYATARREYGNELKNTKHLFEGGVVLPPTALTVSEFAKKYKKAIKDGKKLSAVVSAMTSEIDSAAHRISKTDIMKVFDWLTKEQIQYADAMVEYLSVDMAALGNETSMQMSGFEKYNEGYYVPYNSASNYLASNSAITSDTKLKHSSFTHNVSEGAKTPLILSDFSEVCASHIDRMCMYNALAIPIDTMEKILNFKMPSVDAEGNVIESDISGKSVKAELERAFGSESVKYIEQFIKDMNGNVRKSGDNTILSNLISKFKKGAVLASASVTIQQPSAIMRAMAYVDPKHFLKTKKYNVSKNYEEMVKYAAVAGIKEMGRFDTSTGVSTTKWLLREMPVGMKDKTKAFFDIKDSSYRDDVLSFGAAMADQITWGHIWAAVKAEISDKGNYTPGTKEFYEACSARFTSVINHTQVYDSTLSRSHLMRDKSEIANMISSFMSEPTVSLNLLMSAASAAGSKTKSGRKFAGRAVAAFVGNVLLNAALKSLITAARDDDEDETYLEKYLTAFGSNFASDINPLNLIPLVKDIVSIFEGYTVERADMSLISDFAQSLKVLNNENKTILEKFESLAGSLSAFTGVPVKNVLRDLRAAWNVIDIAFISKPKGDLQGTIFAATGVEGNDKYSALIKAAEKGDNAEYQRIYQHLLDRGVSDADIKANIKKLYRKDGDVTKEAKGYLKDLTENKTYQSFDDETKEDIQSDILTIIAQEKTVKVMTRDTDRFDELYEAKRKNKTLYKKLRQQMLDEGMSEGLIDDGEEIAKIAYMKSIGIDIKEYLLFKTATSVKYADTDGSGGVSKAEKRNAAKDIEIDNKAKQYLLKQ